LLEGGKVKEIHALHEEGQSIRSIAASLGVSRNTVRKYLRNPGLPQPKPRPEVPSKGV
jgi:transposase